MGPAVLFLCLFPKHEVKYAPQYLQTRRQNTRDGEAAYDASHIIKLAGLHSNTTAQRSGLSCLNTLPAFITYCSIVLGSLIIDFGNASTAEANFPIARYRGKDQIEGG